MAVNKVVYGTDVLVDLTSDTVTPDTLAEGVTAHDNSGSTIVGTMKQNKIIEALTPARIVAQFDSTFTSNVSGLISGPADFIKAIYDDYTSLTDSSANLYFFSVKRLDVTLETSGVVGTMDSFFIRSATETAIQVTTESAYNRWFSKNANSSTITLTEQQNSGFTIGNAIGNTKTINASGAFRTGVSIPAGTYRFIVYRVQLADDTTTAVKTEGVGISADSSGIISAKSLALYGVKTVTSWEASFTSDVTSTINVPISESKFKAILADYQSISAPDMNMYCYAIRRKNFDLAYGGYIGQAEPFVITSASESSITVNRYSTNSRRITKTANSNSYSYSVAGGIGFVIGNKVVASSVITLDSGAVAAFNASNVLPAGNYEISILRICDQAEISGSEIISTYQLSSDDDENFIPENIISGITIFGLKGSSSGGNTIHIEGAVPNSTVTLAGNEKTYSSIADETGKCTVIVNAGIYTVSDSVHTTQVSIKDEFLAKFILPVGYKMVEYITLIDSKIDTGVTGGDSGAYWIAFNNLTYTNTRDVWGNGTGSGNVSNSIPKIVSTQGVTQRFYQNGGYWQSNSITSLYIDENGVGRVRPDSTSVLHSFSANTGWGEISWKIWGTTTNGTQYMRLVMRKDGITVRDYYPCIRESDEQPGMFDVVNDEFTTTTGTILAGPDV